jgi:hypothetical protein
VSLVLPESAVGTSISACLSLSHISFCTVLLQRFQQREYAEIEIVQTEKKGFGLRAAKDLPRCVLRMSFFIACDLNVTIEMLSFMNM